MDYYQRLGISQSASPEEVKKAYRRLVMIYHPDRNGGREEDFKQINEAYDTLSDPVKRSHYNLRYVKAKAVKPPKPNARPVKKKNPYTKFEERMAWIAANDPNMGNVKDVRPSGLGGEPPPKKDWVDAFFQSYMNGYQEDIRRGK